MACNFYTTGVSNFKANEFTNEKNLNKLLQFHYTGILDYVQNVIPVTYVVTKFKMQMTT